MTCPLCGSRPLVLVTIIRPTGFRYRRLRCSRCSHRWSTRTPGTEPIRTGRPPALAPAEVRDILTSTDSSYVLADCYGIAPSTVQKIRRREIYAHIFPELPPWQPQPRTRAPVVRPRRASCINCTHYQGLGTPCHLGHIPPVVGCADFTTAPD
jgi:hypothetical protein